MDDGSLVQERLEVFNLPKQKTLNFYKKAVFEIRIINMIVNVEPPLSKDFMKSDKIKS